MEVGVVKGHKIVFGYEIIIYNISLQSTMRSGQRAPPTAIKPKLKNQATTTLYSHFILNPIHKLNIELEHHSPASKTKKCIQYSTSTCLLYFHFNKTLITLPINHVNWLNGRSRTKIQTKLKKCKK